MAEVTQKLFRNPKWKTFLDNLPNQHDRDVAGHTMDWIKTEYPELERTLNGDLVWEHTTGRV